jgi:TrmH family RNA methyltransferase
MLVAAPELLDGERARRAAAMRERVEAPSLEVTAEVLNSISPQDGHQGIAAVARQRWEKLEEVELSAESCWVAVDRIRHPGSLGTILRVCDAVGGEGVVLIGEGSDPYDPTAVRASLGAVFSQRLVKASFEQFAAWRARQECLVVGTSPAAGLDYREAEYRSPTVVFMGNDRSGLSPEQEEICDMVVTIPMAGRCDSHHVAVAAGIVLYEVFYQRRGARLSCVGRSGAGG